MFDNAIETIKIVREIGVVYAIAAAIIILCMAISNGTPEEQNE